MGAERRTVTEREMAENLSAILDAVAEGAVVTVEREKGAVTLAGLADDVRKHDQRDGFIALSEVLDAVATDFGGYRFRRDDAYEERAAPRS